MTKSLIVGCTIGPKGKIGGGLTNLQLFGCLALLNKFIIFFVDILRKGFAYRFFPEV
jgi:hypothetical protein